MTTISGIFKKKINNLLTKKMLFSIFGSKPGNYFEKGKDNYGIKYLTYLKPFRFSTHTTQAILIVGQHLSGLPRCL